MSNWYRDSYLGNFYFDPNSGFSVPDDFYKHGGFRSVKFHNISPWVAIKEIHILYEPKGNMSVRMESGPKEMTKIKQAIDLWLKQHKSSTSIEFVANDYHWLQKFVGYKFSLLSVDDFTQFNHLLLSINQVAETEIFSADILAEFTSITDYCINLYNANKIFKNTTHLIPQMQPKQDFSNPKYTLTTRLADHLFEHRLEGKLNDAAFQKFQSLLAEGEDVHQKQSIIGYQPLAIAWWYTNDIRVFEHLFYYHAQAFLRLYDQSPAYSTWDLALHGNHAEIINLIIAINTHVERPIPFKIKDISISFSAKSIKSKIDWHLTDDLAKTLVDTVETELKKSIEPEEELAIVEMSKIAFSKKDDPDKKLLEAAIREDLHTNSMVEVFRHQNAIIGYSIYNIYITDSNTIYWYCSLSLLTGKFRRTAWMGVKLWEYAHALKKWLRDKNIGVFFLGVHPNSYRLVENHLFWPMYQPEHLKKEILQLLQVLHLADDATFEHRTLACYVNNQLMVNEASNGNAEPAREFRNDFFFRYVLDQGDNKSSGYKAALVVCNITERTFKSFFLQGNKLGINVHLHLEILSSALKVFLADCKTLPVQQDLPLPTNYIWNEQYSFWNREQIASEDMARVLIAPYMPKF